MSAPFKLISSETVPLTPELAEEFREMEPSPTEREVSPNRLKYLQERAGAGQLINFNWVRAKLGNKVLRMNGRHSSTVVSGMNGSFPRDLYVHLDTYEVPDKAGLAVLFRQFDARQSSRTALDVSGAYQMLHESLFGVAKPVAKLAVEGVRWYRGQVEKAPVPNGDDVFNLFDETALHGFVQFLGHLFSIKTPELKSPPIVGAIYATCIANDAAARSFWLEVARGGNEMEENSPTTRLDAWLKSLRDSDEPKPEKVGRGQVYQGCIFAWNAYRAEKPIKEIKYDTRKGYFPVSE